MLLLYVVFIINFEGILRIIFNRFFLTLFLGVFACAPAWAMCTLPDGVEGEFIYNKDQKVAQYCNGEKWIGMGWLAGGGGGGPASSGVPSGAVMAFDLADCPEGWSAYAQSSGRFLRGRCIDGEPCHDPDGTRIAGNVQVDNFQGHWHRIQSPERTNYTGSTSLGGSSNHGGIQHTGQASAGVKFVAKDIIDDGTNGTPRVGPETRPVNVAVLYCRKD